MRLRVLDTGLRPARWNVAMSAALLASVDESGSAALRFHRYPLACVIGRNQDAATELDLAGCHGAGVEIARRVTGGGAVVMGPGVLAFDLVIPATGRTAHAVPRQAGEALAAALRDLGFDARLATPCSIEVDGLKVSGSAGRLGQRAALHQATLILDLAQAAPLTLLRRRTEGGKPTADPRHRLGDLSHRALPLPSPLAGEGGPAEQGRMRGSPPSSMLELDPSSVSASRCHLLPQGEKERRGDVQGRLTRALAATFDLAPEAGRVSTAELTRAEAILARTVGRDDFVLSGDVGERQAA